MTRFFSDSGDRPPDRHLEKAETQRRNEPTPLLRSLANERRTCPEQSSRQVARTSRFQSRRSPVQIPSPAPPFKGSRRDPRVAGDVGRHDSGQAVMLSHRSASAALGSSSPAATRRNMTARR
jgi:hypothetical protein